MDRRQFLLVAGGIGHALSGCLGDTPPQTDGDVATAPVADLEMSPVTDEGIARKVTYRIDAAHRTAEREFAASVIDDGPVTTTATNRPAPEHRPFVYDGAVYELSYDVVDSTPATTFRFTVTAVEADGTDSETIDRTDLSPTDEAVFERYGWGDDGPIAAHGVAVTYPDDAIGDSVLVPEPASPVVVWESGRGRRVRVEEGAAAELTEYEYTARQVHESAERFGRTIREEYGFPLDGLSPAEHAIVSDAIERTGGYEIREGDPPAAFRGVVETFSRHDSVDPVSRENEGETTVSGRYVVRYDGDVYWAELYLREDGPSPRL